MDVLTRRTAPARFNTVRPRSGPDFYGRKGGIVVIAVIDQRRQDGRMTRRTVLFLLFDGVQSLDVTGPLEVFAGAGYETMTASLGGGTVTTSSGLGLVPGRDLRTLGAAGPDTLIVPGGQGTLDPDPELIEWLRAHGPGAKRITSVCTGAFLLAEAGLLDGRRATTHWAYADTLARRFPAVTVDPNPIFIRDGSVATSAGVTAGIDLALALVEEDIGHEAALAVARGLVVYLRRPGGQAQFSAQLRAQAAQRAPLREVQHWISEHPAADLSVAALAGRAGLSPRQFARAFTAEIGMTPGKFVSQVRLETARRMLAGPGQGISQVARACGYGTPEAMRRAFVQSLGVPPASYRHMF
jgi:transcriptional regulator GlxA family with amidase domain